MAMGLVKGEGIGLQQGIQELKTAPARFNQEMHAHALASSRDQLTMPPLAAQLCSAQISESRAEASALMARQPRLETRDSAAAAACAPRTEPTRRTRHAPRRRRLDSTPHPRHSHPRHTLTLVDVRRSQLPPILGGDAGGYRKWALVLQEQLAHGQGERAGVAQQVVSLKQENEQLRQALETGTATSATPGAAAPDAAAPAVPASASAAGDSAETLVLSASDRITTRSTAVELALPGASQAESRRSARGAAAEAPPAAAAFLPPQRGVAPQQGVPQQGVVSEPAALHSATPAPAGSPTAAAGLGRAAGSSAGGGQKRPLSEEEAPSPFSSPNLRFLAGFLDAPGMQPSGGAPPQLWGHAERAGADEGRGAGGGGQAKLQRGASTAKTIGRFDRLQPGR